MWTLNMNILFQSFENHTKIWLLKRCNKTMSIKLCITFQNLKCGWFFYKFLSVVLSTDILLKWTFYKMRIQLWLILKIEYILKYSTWNNHASDIHTLKLCKITFIEGEMTQKIMVKSVLWWSNYHVYFKSFTFLFLLKTVADTSIAWCVGFWHFITYRG